MNPTPALRWTVIGAALLLATAAGVWAYGQQQRQLERRVLQAALAVRPETVVVQTQRTDTVIRRLTRITQRIDSIHVPDTVRLQYPVVDTLVIAVDSFKMDVDTLTRRLAAERATRDSALDAARVATVAAIREHDNPRTAQRWADRARGFVVGALTRFIK